MARLNLLAAGLVSLLLCFATLMGSAQRSVECQMVWTGESSDNDLLDCLKDKDRIRSQWRFYVFPGLCAVFFLFTLIGLPIIFCTRCCTCCRAVLRPKPTTDPATANCWLWMWIVIAVILAFGVCMLLIIGAALLATSAKNILDDVQYKTVSYFDELRDNISYLLINHTDPDAPPTTVDLSAFDTVDKQIGDNAAKIRHKYLKYFTVAEVVAIVVGVIGISLMLCMLLFAFRCCTWCGSVCWSGFYLVFAILFAALAVVFAVVIYAMFAACGEVTLHYRREPGVFQWYLVPWCESKFDFSSIRSEVASEESVAAQGACEGLLNYCDNEISYSTVNVSHIFMCGNGISSKTDCTSFDDVVDVIANTYGKRILTNTLCEFLPETTKLERCTVAECAKRCPDYTAPNMPAKKMATAIMNGALYAANVSAALSYVDPLLECNYIIDKLLNSIETPKFGSSYHGTDDDNRRHCSAVRSASVMLTVGFLVGSLMFILGIYIMHRGSWFWERRPASKTAGKMKPKTPH